jgi:hypothetical protein
MCIYFFSVGYILKKFPEVEQTESFQRRNKATWGGGEKGEREEVGREGENEEKMNK